MEIRMKSIMVGPSVSRQPGETCVVTAEEGQMLIKGGYAEDIGKPPEAKTNESDPDEPAAPEETIGRKKGGKN